MPLDVYFHYPNLKATVWVRFWVLNLALQSKFKWPACKLIVQWISDSLTFDSALQSKCKWTACSTVDIWFSRFWVLNSAFQSKFKRKQTACKLIVQWILDACLHKCCMNLPIQGYNSEHRWGLGASESAASLFMVIVYSCSKLAFPCWYIWNGNKIYMSLRRWSRMMSTLMISSSFLTCWFSLTWTIEHLMDDLLLWGYGIISPM